MACSRFEYVKNFEDHQRLLPGCWAVIRVDGRRFTRFCKIHSFQKPNDIRALELSNRAAICVLQSLSCEIILAYGQSDEYSFVLRRESNLFSRRHEKILSTIVSIFSANYVRYWNEYFDFNMKETACFDGRIVCYPTTKHLRDYLSWRQADVHVNNLFNTVYWKLILNGMNPKDANIRLKDTTSAQKNEILFDQFGINYNQQLAIFRKGTVIFKQQANIKDVAAWKRKREEKKQTTTKQIEEEAQSQHDTKQNNHNGYVMQSVDIIGDKFWNEYPHLLWPPDDTPPRIPKT